MLPRLEYSRPFVYFAGPLFSRAELAFNELVVSQLEEHLDVYLPQRDGGKLVDLIAAGVPRDAAYRSIFERDTAAMREAEAIVIVMDGRAVDEGAAFELGYAFALGKVCVGLQTDPRRLLAAGNNPMIEVPLTQLFSSVEELKSWAERLSQDRRALELP